MSPFLAAAWVSVVGAFFSARVSWGYAIPGSDRIAGIRDRGVTRFREQKS